MNTLRRLNAVITVIALTYVSAVPVAGQNTFTVSVANKTAEHPWANLGWPEGYVVNGTQGATLTLVRGETYVFEMQNVPSIHPFYISTNASGGGAGVWNEGVQGNFATGTASVTFTVPQTAPDVLYYQCSLHGSMGGELQIVSGSTSAEAGELPDGTRLHQNYPNPFNPSTEIRFSLGTPGAARLVVYDATGRALRTLVDSVLPAGDHAAIWDGRSSDHEEAASGAYFYRLETDEGTSTRTMILLR